MSLESILEKIRLEAQEERERIIRESQARAEKIRAEAEQEARRQAEILLQQAGREDELEAHRLVTQARLEQKLHLLDLKKQLVEEVLEKAFAQLSPGTLALKRQIVLKEGVREETLEVDRLKQELRPHLENHVAVLLKL
jgi:vacuolar-type H+-ATPase subunit H